MCQNKYPVKIAERLNPLTGTLYPIYEYVACRKCEECVSIRKSQWCFRALVETEHCYNSSFVTLTYNDDNLPSQGVMVRDCQLFFKRLRKNISLWYPEFNTKKYRLRYFLVSEYGGKFGRPHYHLILWNCPLTNEELANTWKNGFVKIGSTTPKSVQYCLKYFAIKEKAPQGKLKNFCLMSKNIGHQWIADNLCYAKSYVVMPGTNVKVPIPKFYREKLGYPKRQYSYDYEPEFYERFSPKYLRSRGLLGKHSIVNRIVNAAVDTFNAFLQDAENYYFYRDECFHRKYDKCHTKDNQ